MRAFNMIQRCGLWPRSFCGSPVLSRHSVLQALSGPCWPSVNFLAICFSPDLNTCRTHTSKRVAQENIHTVFCTNPVSQLPGVPAILSGIYCLQGTGPHCQHCSGIQGQGQNPTDLTQNSGRPSVATESVFSAYPRGLLPR